MDKVCLAASSEPCRRWQAGSSPGDDDDDRGTDPAGADYQDDDDDADDFTAAPLGRTQRLVQTRTPRQDFFKIFTCDCNV